MKTMIFVLITLTSIVYGKTIKIAVIDTGLHSSVRDKVKLCESGHYDFTTNTPAIGQDFNGHGSNVALTITNNLKIKNYCLVIYKYYSDKATGIVNLKRSNDSFKLAIRSKVDYINYSSTGQHKNIEEMFLIEKALMLNINVFVAAGNAGQNLNNKCNHYPACYRNGVKLSSLNVVGNSSETSNTGSVVNHYGDYCSPYYKSLCGTSQSTAYAIANFINKKHGVSNE